MTREDQVENILDELEEEFAKANMPVNDKLTLFAKVSNAIYKCAEQEPCTDAISRANTIDEISRIIFDHPLDGYEDGQLILKTIQDMPSVIPAEKVGQWEWEQEQNKNWGNWHCSECREIMTVCETDWAKINEPIYKYCPNCGAKMQEVEE